MFEYDEIDIRIMELFHVDGRMSNREVARHLKISEGTVRIRLRRFEEHGLLKIATIKQPAAFGLECCAIVHFSIASRHIDNFLEKLFDLKEFYFVSIVLSEMNVYTHAVAKNRQILERLIERKLVPCKGFKKYDFFEIGHTAMYDYAWTI